ncbi:hypothetical protein ILYODFUR_038521 [Ilyodon furcidens]|uniref:Uncharacterized protein n=1 Tax=Ilyodon furcidens TaxID=33524 RepID=A0ABV0VM37_9TELE
MVTHSYVCYDSGPSTFSALTHAINSSASPVCCSAITVIPHTCGAAVIFSHLTGRRCQIFENISLEFDPVSVPGFTPPPNHWFIQPEPAWLSNSPGIIVKRTITALCVPVTASADSP